MEPPREFSRPGSAVEPSGTPCVEDCESEDDFYAETAEWPEK